MRRGNFTRKLPLCRRDALMCERELAVESCSETAANSHDQQPIGCVYGKEIDAAVLENVLGKERRRHESKPADDAELGAPREGDGPRPTYNVRNHKGEKQAGDKRRDNAEEIGRGA